MPSYLAKIKVGGKSKNIKIEAENETEAMKMAKMEGKIKSMRLVV